MQGRTVFRRIDDIASEQSGASFLDLRGPREIDQKLARCAVEPLLGKIEEQIAERDMEIREALRIARKQVGNRHITEIEAMRFERIERFGNFGTVHVESGKSDYGTIIIGVGWTGKASGADSFRPIAEADEPGRPAPQPW